MLGTQKSEVGWYNCSVLEGKALELVEQLLCHKSNYIGMNKADIERDLADGSLRIYMIDDGEFEAWWMCRVVNSGSNGLRELIIHGLIGTGVFRNAKKILDAWIDLAEFHDCQFIWAQTSEPAVARVLEHNRFLPLTQTFVFGVPNGRKQ